MRGSWWGTSLACRPGVAPENQNVGRGLGTSEASLSQLSRAKFRKLPSEAAVPHPGAGLVEAGPYGTARDRTRSRESAGPLGVRLQCPARPASSGLVPYGRTEPRSPPPRPGWPHTPDAGPG
eukprot:766964-Hanusia_phi.AAC.1